MSLKFVPPNEPLQRFILGKGENAFCTLVTGTSVGCEACFVTQVRLHRSIAQKLVPQQLYYFAGLTELAVPVFISEQVALTPMGKK